jgi:mono/diheme cytochrome c family protein
MIAKDISTTVFPMLLTLLIISCDVKPEKIVPDEYKAGQIVFHNFCANCHGPDAMGGNKAPKLVQEKFAPENYSNGKIARTILNGSSSGAMPSQRGKVSDKEIKQIIKYLRYSQMTYKAAS